MNDRISVFQCDVIAENRAGKWVVCGRLQKEGEKHGQLVEIHESNSIASFHHTHKVTIAPIDGLLCENCEAYWSGPEDVVGPASTLVSQPCPGPSERMKQMWAKAAEKNIHAGTIKAFGYGEPI